MDKQKETELSDEQKNAVKESEEDNQSLKEDSDSTEDDNTDDYGNLPSDLLDNMVVKFKI